MFQKQQVMLIFLCSTYYRCFSQVYLYISTILHIPLNIQKPGCIRVVPGMKPTSCVPSFRLITAFVSDFLMILLGAFMQKHWVMLCHSLYATQEQVFG